MRITQGLQKCGSCAAARRTMQADGKAQTPEKRRPRSAGPSHNLVSSPLRVAREWRFLGLRRQVTSLDTHVNLWRAVL